jgi:hypothetical protein
MQLLIALPALPRALFALELPWTLRDQLLCNPEVKFSINVASGSRYDIHT